MSLDNDKPDGPPRIGAKVKLVGGARDGEVVSYVGPWLAVPEEVKVTWSSTDEEKPLNFVVHEYRINSVGTAYLHMCCGTNYSSLGKESS